MISGLYLCTSLLAVFGIIGSLLGPNLFSVLFVILPVLVPSSFCSSRHGGGTISYIKCGIDVWLLLLLANLSQERGGGTLPQW